VPTERTWLQRIVIRMRILACFRIISFLSIYRLFLAVSTAPELQSEDKRLKKFNVNSDEHAKTNARTQAFIRWLTA
jgi:hypothetical protein